MSEEIKKEDQSWPTIIDRVSARVLEEDLGYPTVPTGLAAIDKDLGGLHNGDLIVLGSRPAMGKSSLARNIIQRASLGHNGGDQHTVGVFCLEDSQDNWTKKMICSLARVPMWRDYFSKADTEKISAANERLRQAPIVIEEAPWLEVQGLCDRARKMKKAHGIDLLVIDSLQQLGPPSNFSGDQVRGLGVISYELKALAEELDIPVLLVSQLARWEEELSGNGHPGLWNLRDLGDIDRYADFVMLLYRPAYYNRYEDDTLAIIHAAKSKKCRYDARLNFYPEFMAFDDRNDPNERRSL